MPQLSKDFTIREMRCPCGCGRMGFTPEAIDRLQRLRDEFARPMQVVSGFRCSDYNVDVSTTGPFGPHTRTENQSLAADVKVLGRDAYDLMQLIAKYGFYGVGVSQKGDHSARFIHIDCVESLKHPRPWVWSY